MYFRIATRLIALILIAGILTSMGIGRLVQMALVLGIAGLTINWLWKRHRLGQELKTQGRTLCHCGRPLHYNDPHIEAEVRKLVALLGPDVKVTVGDRTWKVQRHFIALHGIQAQQLPYLAFPEIKL